MTRPGRELLQVLAAARARVEHRHTGHRWNLAVISERAEQLSDTTFPRFDSYDPMRDCSEPDPLKAARHEQPVFHMDEYDMWCVSRYEDVVRVLSDVEVFSATAYATGAGVDAGDDGLPTSVLNSDMMLANDPPRHTMIRRAFQKRFTPRAVSEQEGTVRELANSLIDRFVTDGHANLMDSFASPLPIAVVGDIVGLPRSRATQFREYIEACIRLDFATDIDRVQRSTYWQWVQEFEAYLFGMMADRRREPVDDLISELVGEHGDGRPGGLSDAELLTNIVGLARAGGDTTAILICHSLRALHAQGANWAALRADSTLIANAVEESLRHHGPVAGLFRTARVDCELSGTKIPAGARVYVSVRSANHDETVFPDPGRFDPARANLVRHLGFGVANHFCVGAHLARLEARVALECLIDRLPDLTVAPEAGEYKPNLIFPQLVNLDVTWAPPS